MMTARLRHATLLLLALAVTVVLGAAAPAARAAETIDSFRSEIGIAADGDVTVTEIITVNAEGRDIRRGIFRDFPLYMLDASGRRQKVDFEVLSVARDGSSEAWHTETISGGIRIFMGSSETTLNPGRHTYELTYRTARQIRYFDDHDEFYWNVTGNGWMFPIRRASAVVTLPQGVSALQTAAFTGPQGSTARNARQGGQPSAPTFETTRSLGPNEGLTIAVSMPKGSIAPPSADQRRRWFIEDNLNFLIGAGGLAIVTLYYVWFWRRVGRDPDGGVVVPRWDAPDGLSPALVNYVHNKGFSGAGWDALSASFIDLAVKGQVVLEDLKSRIVIRRTQKALPADMPVGQQVLLRRLGASSNRLVIDKANGVQVQSIAQEFRQAIEKEHRGRYYKANIGYVIGGAVLSVLVLVALFLLGDIETDIAAIFVMPAFFGVFCAPVAIRAGRSLRRGGSIGARIDAVLGFAVMGFVGLGIFGALIVGVVESIDSGHWPLFTAIGGLALVNAVFFYLMGAPTPLGAKLMAGIEGLKIYLTLAEKDRLNMAGAPTMSPQHFETLLPYAVALGVEKPWSETFNLWLASAAAGAAAAYQPVWYSGDSIGSFGDSIGGFSSSMASTIASTIPQPTSSSSSGFSSGGGFSGGGGGGGGGGGW